MAPETAGDRFLKAICRLPARVRDVVPLGNGFWYIREGDHKSSLLFFRSQGRGIYKGLHRVLLQVGEGQTKLREHSVQRSGMATGRLADACLKDSGVHGLLQDQFVERVPSDDACARGVRHLGFGQDILPPYLIIGSGERSPANLGVCLRDTAGSAERKVRLQFLFV